MTLYTFMLLLSSANAKKGGGDAAQASNTASANQSTAAVADVPADGDSKKFAKALVGLNITNFRPISDGLVYEKLSFSADNTWQAEAAVELMDEKMECIEKGTWTMDPAESSKVASMVWKIESTDCPARSAPEDVRLKVTIEGSGIQVAFR
ncbi:MAG: hypothetical protein VXZ96_17635 [Myxococcota bacterium]|nr:hypothetical protein [Myxococcota bacterium]